ncbi:hypothetical protein [Bifidobacterium canis]|uniref:hypothetical protein n=1 Tax=Bifidobacterium canis TaxID=2610880 RepID=UPI0018C252BA|nr:hypothetical protein [Bifidobacterium canis]
MESTLVDNIEQVLAPSRVERFQCKKQRRSRISHRSLRATRMFGDGETHVTAASRVDSSAAALCGRAHTATHST